MDDKDLKICIPIPDRKEGGLYTFLSNFVSYLESKNIEYTRNIDDKYNILFVNSWVVPYDLIFKLKKEHKNLRVIQRIDGSARDYGRYDRADIRQARVNMLADLTIFQSKYSKFCTTKKFKIIQHNGPIIYNPVDIVAFNPDGPKIKLSGKIKVCNSSYSLNIKKGTHQIAQLAEQNPDVTFALCGRYPELPNLKNIKLFGHLEKTKLSNVYRSCNAFLFLGENEACPNVVLEAMACGLPVLYKNSGGTPELVGTCGAAVKINDFKNKLNSILEQPELSQKARERSEKFFSPDQIFPQYLKEIKTSKRKPLPREWEYYFLSFCGYSVMFYSRYELVKYLLEVALAKMRAFGK